MDIPQDSNPRSFCFISSKYPDEQIPLLNRRVAMGYFFSKVCNPFSGILQGPFTISTTSYLEQTTIKLSQLT